MGKYSIRHDKTEQAGMFLGDGKVALGLALGAIGTLVTILVFETAFGAIGRSDYLTVAPVVVSLLVAATSTYLAARALLEQRMAREAGTDPVLVAHLGQREDARELVTFNVSNVGAGAALNVHLNITEPRDDLAKRNLLTDLFRQHHPFAVILQGKAVEFSLAVGWELLGEDPMPPFQARITYEDLAGGKYESEFSIDVREMEGLGANKSPQMRIVSALEKMAQHKSSVI